MALPRTSTVTNGGTLHLSDQRGQDLGPGAVSVVERAIAGDRRALEHLLVEAQELAWRFSMAVCGQPQDAEDAMQEALARTYTHVRQLKDPVLFRPWLYRTVRNACLMSRRRRVDEPQHLLSIDDPAAQSRTATRTSRDLRAPLRSPEDAAVNARLRRGLNAALAKLPAPFRAVLFLREMEGLSTSETAETLGMSEANVKTRLRRARLLLQKELATWQPGAPGAGAPAKASARAGGQAR
jgi:RNA polymerase sigma-70 factor (ECF subfamily)